MPSKLNRECRRLFLELAARKKHYGPDKKQSLFLFAKYPMLSKSFLCASTHSRPAFILGIIVDDSGLVEVCFSSPIYIDPFFSYACGLKMTPESFRKIFSLLNPPTIYVNLSSCNFSDDVQNIFDGYRGTLKLVSHDTANFEPSIPMVNEWNPKICSLSYRTAEMLLHEEVLPMDLDYCDICRIRKDEFQLLFDRHTIKSLHLWNFKCDVGEREMPLKHIKSLKRLAAWVCVDEFHLFADFFARNDFSLEKLSVTGNGFLSHHNYNNISDYNVLLNNIRNAYHKVLPVKEKCSNLTKELHVQLRMKGNYTYASFDHEWIGKLRRDCDFLKDAKYDAAIYNWRLMTRLFDEHVTIDLEIRFGL